MAHFRLTARVCLPPFKGEESTRDTGIESGEQAPVSIGAIDCVFNWELQIEWA